MVLVFHDKVTIEMACSEPNVEATIAAIVFSARTGEVGKVFCAGARARSPDPDR